jgi:hypothetical protein
MRVATLSQEVTVFWRDGKVTYTDQEWEKGSRISGPKEPCPTVEEVERSIGDLKPGKAVGPDDIPAELLKFGGKSVVKAMHRLIQIVWETGKWPNVPLFKKGDPTVCSNYRTISLISHASKVLLKIIHGRMRPKMEEEEQAGFRLGRGTHNHLCSLRIIMEKARARRQPLYNCASWTSKRRSTRSVIKVVESDD